jgi:hypothetical protein
MGQSAVKRLWRQKSDDTDCHYARVTTAVISDLHVGAVSKRSVATDPAPLNALRERLADVEHLVLLGDVLELREAPIGRVMADAEPLFRALGETIGDGRVTIVPGNHDHQLAAPVTHRRRLDGSEPLPLDASAPPPAGGPLGRIAGWLDPAEVTVAYPGLWIRPDVFATHGHYLDLHNTVPALECLAVSLTERVLGRSTHGRNTPDDYEAAVAPPYSLMFELAQARVPSPRAAGGPSLAIWRRTGGAAEPTIGGRLLAGVAIPAVVGALNRAGLGPFRPELNGQALRRSALRAMSDVVDRLGIDAPHVLFGHTHRSGPWPGDDMAEWSLPGGGRLVNSGCWILDEAFGATGPYAPGPCVFVDDEGPPRLEWLIEE